MLCSGRAEQQSQQQRQRRDASKEVSSTVTVSDSMTVRQLAAELKLSVEDLEGKLAGIDEAVASHEDMCASDLALP